MKVKIRNIVFIISMWLMVLLSVFWVVSVSYKVKAADEENTNFVQTLFKESAKFCPELTGDDNPNVVCNILNTINSISSIITAFMSGTDSIDESGMSVHNPGIVEYAFGLAYSSVWVEPIQIDPIDTTYASMFLPKGIYSPSVDSDVYAGSQDGLDWSDPSSPKPIYQPDQNSINGSQNIQGEIDPASAHTFLNQLGLFTIWKITFGISTLVFVLMLIVAGFMIMFKQKIGGQTLVTLSMAIKNSIYGFLGALASYGVGVFFFNFSKWLSVIVYKLMGGVMSQLMSSGDFYQHMEPFLPVGPWETFKVLMGHSSFGQTAADMVMSLNLSLPSGGNGLGVFLGAILAAIKIVFESFSALIAMLFAMILFAIFSVVFLVKSFQVFTAVLKIYLAMFIDIIMGPLIFIAAIIPGHESSMHSWFKRMFKNATLIPFMFFMMNLVIIVFQIPSNVDIAALLSGGTLIGDPSGSVNAWGILLNLMAKWLAGIALLGMTLKAENILNEMFGVKESQGLAKAMAGAQEAIKNTPIVGGMF